MRPTTRRTLDSSLRHRPPVTRDLRQRQLPTVPSHAVPTRECQSDPPSLPRAIRCSRSRGSPSTQTEPLTFCSMSDLLTRSRWECIGVYSDDMAAVLLPVSGCTRGSGRRRSALAADFSVTGMKQSHLRRGYTLLVRTLAIRFNAGPNGPLHRIQKGETFVQPLGSERGSRWG